MLFVYFTGLLVCFCCICVCDGDQKKDNEEEHLKKEVGTECYRDVDKLRKKR